jgi:hypothetical protein
MEGGVTSLVGDHGFRFIRMPQRIRDERGDLVHARHDDRRVLKYGVRGLKGGSGRGEPSETQLEMMLMWSDFQGTGVRVRKGSC